MLNNGNCLYFLSLESLMELLVKFLQTNSQLLLWSWKAADCSPVDNLIAKKLILPTFRPDTPVLLREVGHNIYRRYTYIIVLWHCTVPLQYVMLSALMHTW